MAGLRRIKYSRFDDSAEATRENWISTEVYMFKENATLHYFHLPQMKTFPIKPHKELEYLL